MSLRRIVPGPLKRAAWPAYRRLAATGWFRRLVHRPASSEEMRSFWLEPTTEANRPEAYLAKHGRSRVVVEMISELAEPGERVLEIGCNVGRNLEHLRRAGYTDLAGIELSAEAVELLRSSYPQLAEVADVRTGSVEDAIGDVPDRAYDLVFTAEVLQHLPDSSDWVFGEIARVTGRALVTIEDEVSVRRLVVPRDYRAVFEPFGLRQTMERDLASVDGFKPGIVARAFTR